MQKRFLQVAFCVLSSAALAAGCAKARAQTVPDGPPLVIPAPPSRVFAPIEEEEPLATLPVPDAPTARVPSVIPNRPPARPRPPETERIEQTPAPAPAPAASPETPRELRAASSPDAAEAEKKIGESLRRTSQMLGGIYYQGLSVGRKENYDQAKAFIAEAEQVMKERNFVYAETLADKAAKLAAELGGR